MIMYVFFKTSDFEVLLKAKTLECLNEDAFEPLNHQYAVGFFLPNSAKFYIVGTYIKNEAFATVSYLNGSAEGSS